MDFLEELKNESDRILLDMYLNTGKEQDSDHKEIVQQKEEGEIKEWQP